MRLLRQVTLRVDGFRRVVRHGLVTQDGLSLTIRRSLKKASPRVHCSACQLCHNTLDLTFSMACHVFAVSANDSDQNSE